MVSTLESNNLRKHKSVFVTMLFYVSISDKFLLFLEKRAQMMSHFHFKPSWFSHKHVYAIRSRQICALFVSLMTIAWANTHSSGDILYHKLVSGFTVSIRKYAWHRSTFDMHPLWTYRLSNESIMVVLHDAAVMEYRFDGFFAPLP